MEINIKNYELFIIDYMDNKLSTFETAQLLVFLEEHPGLKTEMEGINLLKVVPSNESFGFNDALLQPSDKDAVNLDNTNYTHYFVASLENDLSNTGKEKLKLFLEENPDLVKEYNLFASCKVVHDPSIVYPDPSSLIKQVRPVYLRIFESVALAASVLILLSIFLRLEPDSSESIDSVIKNEVNKPVEGKVTPANDKSLNLKAEENINTGKVNSKPAKQSNSKPTKIIKAIVPVKREEIPPINRIPKRKYTLNTTSLISENTTKHFYSNLYDDIKLSQELALASKEVEAVPQLQERGQGAVKTGRIISSIINSGNQIVEQVPQSMSGWLIADLGMKGFNLLTNNNYQIDRQIADKGKIEKLAITNKE